MSHPQLKMENLDQNQKTMTKDALERELNRVATKAVMFVNFSDEVFSGTPYIGKDGKERVDEHCRWDGSPLHFEAGEVQYVPQFQFIRLQKHLVDREMNKAGIPTNNHLRKEYEAKCSVPVVKSEVEAINAQAEQEFNKLQETTDHAKEIEEAMSQAPKNKGGRPKKKPLEESTFEGLNNEGSVS